MAELAKEFPDPHRWESDAGSAEFYLTTGTATRYCTIRQLLFALVGMFLCRSTQSMINSRTSSLER